MESYGLAESDLGGRRDEKEGIAETRLSAKAGKKRVKINAHGLDVELEDSKIVDYQSGVRVNEWIFCGTVGRYSRDTHRDLVNGRDGYVGSTGLLAYCVFDLDPLICALRAEVVKAPDYQKLGIVPPIIYERA